MKISYANIAKIFIRVFVLSFALFLISPSCSILKHRLRKDPQAQAEKKEAKALKKYHKAYNKGVKKYQKEVAGGDTEMGKNRKIYKRMKKNHRASKRINKNKTATPGIIRFFRKDRIKEPFHKRMGRKIKRFVGKIFKKDS